MRVLFLSGRELAYPRNDVLLRAFDRLGEVDVIDVPRDGSIVSRTLMGMFRALLTHRSEDYDLIFVGFYGHLMMLLAHRWFRAPVLFDAFVSTYDTLCFDRAQFKPSSLIGKAAFALDKGACTRSNMVLLDTVQHMQYFGETFGLPASNFSPLPVGCNEDIFYPRSDATVIEGQILFYCTYLPVHGIETILQAAALLEGFENARFTLIGEGVGLDDAKNFARKLQLSNVSFSPYMSLTSLSQEVAASSICLGGHFGTSDKAERVVPSKIYQLMAMAKPIVAGDTTANRDLLTDGKSALMCPRNDPEALAGCIQILLNDAGLRERLGRAARRKYEECCSEKIITKLLGEIVSGIVDVEN